MSLDEMFESSAAEDVNKNADQRKGKMFVAAPAPILGDIVMPSVKPVKATTTGWVGPSEACVLTLNKTMFATLM